MIRVNGEEINMKQFPDGTLSTKIAVPKEADGNVVKYIKIQWLYENNAELVSLIFITKHLKNAGVEDIDLDMPYIPNARQDRVKNEEDVFTLKYFAEIINGLGFKSVSVLDPHSYVSEAVIDRIKICSPKGYVEEVLSKVGEVTMFYPDEGAMKRYSGMIDRPYVFGMKNRDWKTGNILGLDVVGATELIEGRDVLIVDDICSRGGTFYHSAKRLKELGAMKIYLYISHCENSILEGEVLSSGLIEKVFTTNSIFAGEHEKVEVIM